MRKTLIAVIMVLMFAMSTAGCSIGGSVESLPKVTTKDVSDSTSVINTLNEARVITAKKDVISWGDQWTLKADGVKIATIKGQPLYMIGDTYSMFTLKGNLVGSEGEQFRLVEHKAKLYDYNNKQIGQINQEVFSLLYKFTFYDGKMNKTGTMNQNFNLVLNGDIKDNNGTVVWNIKKDAFSVGSSLRIERKAPSDIDAMTATWQALMVNEIDEGSNS